MDILGGKMVIKLNQGRSLKKKQVSRMIPV